MDTTERSLASTDSTHSDHHSTDPPEAAPSVPTQPPDPESSESDPSEPDPSGPEPSAEPEPPSGPEPSSELARWEAFAPEPDRPPGRLRRAAAALGRRLGHEWTLAVLGGLALAVAMTWPALRYPRYTLPQDLVDPSLVTWILAWPGHALLNDPSQLWHGNAFYPQGRWSLAFTDSLLGYAPFALVGNGPLDAVLRYNIIYVLAYALAFIGAYALARQLGAVRAGALVVALAFAYAPWRLAHAGHLHVLSTGGIALALAMLARGHGWSLRRGRGRGRVRPGWIVAGWLVAAWQVTIGFGIGLVFGYVLLLAVAVVLVVWLVRRVLRRRRHPIGAIVGANLVGGTVFAATTVLMALPYLTVVNQFPDAARSLAEVELLSPPLRSFLIAPEQSWLWGSLHEAARSVPVSPQKGFWAPEMTLLPGFVLLGLAVAGLFFSAWSVRVRALLAAGVVATGALAMGTELSDGLLYEPLYNHLPGWDALRTPGRLVIWVTLLLAVLAAGTVSAFVARSRELARARGAREPGGWLRLAALLPAALVLVEGFGATPHPVVPPQPAALASVPGPVLVLPSNATTDPQVMLWTTDRFVPVANGASGFDPPARDEMRRETVGFPTPDSVDYLRDVGVATVVVLPDRVVGTEWEPALNASGAGLGLTREEIDGSIVFHLDPPPDG